VWKTIRIGVLLIVLAAVAVSAWLDRRNTQSWHDTLWVGLYPLNADGSAEVARYIGSLAAKDFTPIEDFLSREAHRYGVAAEQPVHIELYPEGHELPPALAPGAGPLGIAWWSLKLRRYAARAADIPGRARPRIRLFVVYYDPSKLDRAPDSHGLQKGLVGVVHAFASRTMSAGNNIVITHELLHTVGATDKYDLGSGEPLYPQGFADPEQRPLYPQERAEIMAVRRALSARDSDFPPGLAAVVVGAATAHEIRWQ
jgi:hypothetical protein